MAKERGTLEQCLWKTIHHVSSSKVRLILACGGGPEDFENRFLLVRENTTAAIAQIGKIRKIAEQTGCKEVLALLDEKTVEFGHDFPTV